MSSAALQPEPGPIVACTIARDVQNFEILIEDMEAELGESWGDLDFVDAANFLSQPDAGSLEFVALAVDEQDEADLPAIGNLISAAKERSIKVILIADEVSPIALHQLLRLGADDFVPYPLPKDALKEAVARIRAPEPAPEQADGASVTQLKFDGRNRDGVILPVHGLAGGVGSTVFATNLAWELATMDGDREARVCLLDFDLQFGSISTYLDLPRREAVYELLANTATMDDEAFKQALLPFKDKLHVLTAPSELLPLDFVSPEDIAALIDMARMHFDFVVIDMPTTVVQWIDTVLDLAHVYFAMIDLDMRSAQNVLRMERAMKAEDLPFEKLKYVLNRGPKFTDMSGKSRVKRMAESLGIVIDSQLPDGGRQVLQSCDHGLPLAETAAKNPTRKAIQALAKSIFEIADVEAAAGEG